MFRCKHDWVLCFEFYAPPAWGAKFNIEVGGERLMEGALLGVTSLLYECSKCQAFHNERLLGKKVEKEPPCP